jgi:acid phosphatase family membrane protein YuiD
MILNTGVEVILASFIAAFTAQFIKFVTYYTKMKKINFKIITETGGMPSSHSAGVVALSTSVGLIESFGSVAFAIAFGYALIVMYDAAGLRRSAGKMASVLNRVVEDVYEHRPPHGKEKLMELLGHTPLEVTMGAILGIFVAIGYHRFLM